MVSYLYGNIDPVEHLSFVTIALNLFISVLLYCYPRVILVGLSLQKSTEKSSVDYTALQGAGLALIGMYFTLSSLIDLFYWQNLYSGLQGLDGGPLSFTPDQMASVYSSTFQLVAGLLVIAAAGRLSRFLTRLRTIGTTTSEGSAGE